jgi:hypothetical protein
MKEQEIIRDEPSRIEMTMLVDEWPKYAWVKGGRSFRLA